MALASPARALPSFAQQTGQPCSACHVGAIGPQLKPYARDFKLFGYQASDGLSKELPIAIAGMESLTHTQAPQEPSAAPHFGANDNLATDQVSVFYGGKAPGGVGVFAQFTYDGVARAFNLDNVDVRKVLALTIKDKDLAIGFDFNNSPTVQDAWNSTPNWGFPYNGSALAPTPAAATLLDGALSHIVAGAGVYAFWDYSVYAEFTAYQPLDRVFVGRLGEGTDSGSDRYSGVIPYARIALNRDFTPRQSLEVGALAIAAQRYPGGVVNFGKDKFTDWAFDASWINEEIRRQTFSAHAIYIHEDQVWSASSLISGTRPKDQLETARADLSWSIHDTWTPSVQVFHTWGTADPALYTGPGGRPDSSGYVVELAYTGLGRPDSKPTWANWRLALQYVGYEEFDGARRGASAANTLYLSLWAAFAPFGGLVHR